MDVNAFFSSSLLYNSNMNWMRYFHDIIDNEIQTLQSFNITINRDTIEPSEFNVRFQFESDMLPLFNTSFVSAGMYLPLDLQSINFSDYIFGTNLPPSSGLTIETIDALSSKVIIQESVECHICLDTLLEGSCMRKLTTCSHKFCIDCIDEWLRSHNNCPVCKATLQ